MNLNFNVIEYLVLTLSIAIGIVGQILFKSGALYGSSGLQTFMNPFTMGAFCAYGVSAILYVWSLKSIPLSVAYPSISISYVFVALLAHFLWGERFGWPQIFSLFLISIGILILCRNSSA